MTRPSVIDRLRTRMAADPRSLAFAQLADAYRREGNFEQAVQICVQGLGHSANYVSAHMVLGRAHQECGDLLAARKAFQRVLELDPESTRAYKYLGQIAEARGETAEALAAYRMALILHPFDKEVRAAVERLEPPLAETTPSPPEPVATLPVTAPPPTEPMATETLAGLYAAQGLYEQAAQIYARLAAEAPDRDDLAQKHRDVMARMGGAVQRTPPVPLATDEAIRLLETWREAFQRLRVRQRGKEGLLEAWRDVFRRLRAKGKTPVDLLSAWRDVFRRLRAAQ